MILSFKPQFVEPILNGSKIHTIRAGNRWKVGDKIHFATGVRTKNYNCFKEGIVKSVQYINIWKNNKTEINYVVFIDNEDCSNQIDKLAINDGFTNLFKFLDFFENGFFGQIIHWTDYKY